MIEFVVKTSSRNQMINITREVSESIPKDLSGMAVVHIPHTTAAVTINEGADPALKNDILNYLEELVPHSAGYTHIEGNSDSHIKSSMIGSSVNLIIDGGKLVLGTWQAIFFCEFDGPRTRKVYLKLIEQ
ncbi:MAG: YjbQ family protein [candidate division Zixibacteria bacterium]|nr:YjbQ family protein [candidate division Zixibacteria bacterium]